MKIVSSLPDPRLLFLPDKNLGMWVQRHTEKEVLLWPGYCPTHQRILAPQVKKLKTQHPNAVVIVHPECSPDVIDLADEVLSTGQMIQWARDADAREVVVGTEIGLIHRLKQENPDKTFYQISPLTTCPNMKRITLEKVAWSLDDMQFEVTVPPDIAARARRAIERMLATG